MQVGERLDEAVSEPLVCVLGPTTVGAELATPRQRSLLAALALAGSQGASIDDLTDAVWAGRPPRSARSSLQNQMTRLRRAHGEGLLVCEHARYWLNRATDVAQFENAASSAGERPDDPNRVEYLASALKLWRGVPYSDLADSHAADIERARLVQQRSNAVELLAAGRIRFHDYERCIADLRAEIEDDPYRDRAWELLLVALQRAGRPSEALAAYRTYVERLRRGLGAEPTPQILSLGRILSRGDLLDIGISASAGQVEPVARASRCGHDPAHRRCAAHRPRRTRNA